MSDAHAGGEAARLARELEQWAEFGYGVEASQVMRDAAAQLSADASRLRALEERIGGYEHEQRLMQADLQQFVTDCSTPTFQLVRNALERLRALETEREDPAT